MVYEGNRSSSKENLMDSGQGFIEKMMVGTHQKEYLSSTQSLSSLIILELYIPQ